ncbi:MAG TPA: sigma-70 family RNA polymerase sigma factor [Mycobacteriales bacterium]|nr:sigma-70 family RNA polymerase sigma factor [Mycobacteriales bacterium]
MSGRAASPPAEQQPLLALYDEALPTVFGYLLSRCGSVSVAEDLTSETFLAAVAAVRAGSAPLSVPWVVGIARHKLVDHWRRRSREELRLAAVAAIAEHDDDPWDVRLDALRAQQTLASLSPAHRTVLTLRYLDDLSVPAVAAELGRTRQATEVLVSRARAAFRREYELRGGDDG